MGLTQGSPQPPQTNIISPKIPDLNASQGPRTPLENSALVQPGGSSPRQQAAPASHVPMGPPSVPTRRGSVSGQGDPVGPLTPASPVVTLSPVGPVTSSSPGAAPSGGPVTPTLGNTLGNPGTPTLGNPATPTLGGSPSRAPSPSTLGPVVQSLIGVPSSPLFLQVQYDDDARVGKGLGKHRFARTLSLSMLPGSLTPRPAYQLPQTCLAAVISVGTNHQRCQRKHFVFWHSFRTTSLQNNGVPFEKFCNQIKIWQW